MWRSQMTSPAEHAAVPSKAPFRTARGRSTRTFLASLLLGLMSRRRGHASARGRVLGGSLRTDRGARTSTAAAPSTTFSRHAKTGGNVCGIAVDRNWVYFATRPGNRIGRASLDGQLLQDSFISGLAQPCGVAVDTQHIYWADTHYADGHGAIGRSNLDGTGRDDAFIGGLNAPCAVAVDAAHVYWSSCGDNDGFGTGTTIGRANLDGSAASDAFITGANGAMGVAVDAAHIYWANNTLSTIGRANLNGTGVDQRFITASPNLPGGPFDPTVAGIAVDAEHIFWNEGEATPQGGYAAWIGRANLDGSGVQPHLTPANSVERGIALDRYTPTATTLTAGTDRAIYGQAVNWRGHVKAVTPPTSATPTGDLEFALDAEPLGSSRMPIDPQTGDALWEPPFLINAGFHFLRADYAGDIRHAPSHAFAQMTVDPAPTRTTMRLDPNPATLGQPFRLSVAVENTSTDVIPFGSVQFFAGGFSLGTLDLDDDGEIQSEITVDPDAAAPGSYTISAIYTDTTRTPADFVSSSAREAVTLNAAAAAQPSAIFTPTASAPTPQAPQARLNPNTFTLRAPTIRRGAITVNLVAPGPGAFTATATTRERLIATAASFTLRTAAKPGVYGTTRKRTTRQARCHS